jgi:arginase
MIKNLFDEVIVANCSQGQQKFGVQEGGEYICKYLDINPSITLEHKIFNDINGEGENGYKILSYMLGSFHEKNGIIKKTLLIGGDHSLGISSVDYFANRYKEKLRVLWIDAHADINDHITSLSGNIHGMPLGYHHISRTDKPCWRKSQYRLSSNQLYYFGIRDLDDSEKELIEKDNIPFSVNTKHNYDKLLKFIDDSKYLLISFDVDSLDPELMSSTGTRSCCGLNCKDVYDVIKYSIDKQKLIHLDIMEFNPELGNVEKSIKSLIEIFQN